MKLSVVIVSYNAKYYLEQCLLSVFHSKVEGGMEVFVVDNNSSDGCIGYLSQRFPQVRYIQNTENVGFSRANNQAIRLAKGEYVLILNPDTILTEHTLQDCISHLDAHPEAGATGVSMYSHDGHFAWESRRGLPTLWTSFCKMSGLGSIFPQSRLFGRYYMRYLDRREPSQIEVISGAFNMMRHKALDQVGLLDEDFFMYGEDIDLSYRLLQGGWQNWYLPTPIIHYKGVSTQKSSYRYVHIFYEAMLIFYRKHFEKGSGGLVTRLITGVVKARAGVDLMQRALQKRFGRKNAVHTINMQDYVVRQFPTQTFDEIIGERIQAYATGDRHSIGIHYPATGITVLPYDILTDAPFVGK